MSDELYDRMDHAPVGFATKAKPSLTVPGQVASPDSVYAAYDGPIESGSSSALYSIYERVSVAAYHGRPTGSSLYEAIDNKRYSLSPRQSSMAIYEPYESSDGEHSYEYEVPSRVSHV